MKKAITIVEVMVAAIILSSVLAGIVATFVSVRRSVGKGGERVTAVNLARGTLDSLYAEVRADKLDGSTMTYAIGSKLEAVKHTLLDQSLDGTTFKSNYTVSSVAGSDYLNATVDVGFTVKGD